MPSKPIDTIRVDILPAVMRHDPALGESIVQAIKDDIERCTVEYRDTIDPAFRTFVYAIQTNTSITLEVTAAERLPVAIIDDSTLLDTLQKAAMERGVGMQQFLRELAKELM